MKDLRGQKVIVRGDRSGVFFGTLVDRDGQEVELANARNIWCWNGAAALNEIAKSGIGKPTQSKVTVAVDIILTDCVEVLIPTAEAIINLEGIKDWSAR